MAKDMFDDIDGEDSIHLISSFLNNRLMKGLEGFGFNHCILHKAFSMDNEFDRSLVVPFP